MDPSELPLGSLRCSFKDCSKILSSKYNLKRHIESCHNGIRPYECSICFKRFSSKQNKREHTRLEHSYSNASNNELSSINQSASETIQIPKLSFLLKFSRDPDIRPLSKLVKIYMYSDIGDPVELPELSEKRQQFNTDSGNN